LISGGGKTAYPYAYDPCLSPCTKINSKWIKELNVSPETPKLVDKSIEEIHEGISI
jgi:hypothetical protein